ncbi:MAG TPA: DUF5668 domain-containing protein [Symbiobacteriaceae bacterium]|nr:DUF5668 domain-containing protein [Symbiobacteriaceae bacterium]
MRFNTGGIILIAIGVVMLLSNLGILSWYALAKWWPLILVAAGVGMLFPRRN